MEEYVKIRRNNYDLLKKELKDIRELYNEVIDELEKDDATVHYYSGITTRFVYGRDGVVKKLANQVKSLELEIAELIAENDELRRRKWYKFW